MKLSIIIPSFNRKELLRECLGSIYANRPCFVFEIIVQDDFSSDGTVEMIKKGFPQVRVFQNTEKGFFAATCNNGAKQAQGDYVMILGQDTKFIDNTLEKLVSFIDKDNVIGAITPGLVYADLKPQYRIRNFPTLKNLFLQMLADVHLLPKKFSYYKLLNFDFSKTREIEQPSADVLVIRKNVFDRLDGFDAENFPGYFNDVDLCYRIKKAGFKIYYLADTKIIHYEGQSFGKMKWGRIRMWDNGLKKFFLKHYVSSKLSWKYLVLLKLLFLKRILLLMNLSFRKY